MDCFKNNCKKYQDEKKKALAENESVMDAIHDLMDVSLDCNNCEYTDCEIKEGKEDGTTEK